MNPADTLKELGLSDGESKVYLALLKLGSVTVAKLKEETGLHRTTIYDFIEKLLNKGLASYVIKGGVKYFTAARPSKLFELVKEKQEHLEETIPELEKISQFVKEEIKVEVYRGVEGFKTALNDILLTTIKQKKKEFCGFGIEESKFHERFPYFMEQLFKKERKAGMQERMIARKGTKFVFKAPHITYKYMPSEFFSPTPMGVYGNKVYIGIWEPLTTIIIENKDLANAWKGYFEFLWSLADEKP